MREFFEEDKKEKKVDEKEKGGNRRWKQKEGGNRCLSGGLQSEGHALARKKEMSQGHWQ